jgi:hypothetical protein
LDSGVFDSCGTFAIFVENTSMKKLVLIIVLLCAAQTHAQEKDSSNSINNKYSLNITAGISMSQGEFASSDIQNEQSGFAENGYSAGVSLWLLPRKHLSLGIDYTYLNHRMVKGMTNQWVVGQSFPLKAGNWNVHALTAGPLLFIGKGAFSAFAGLQGGVAVSLSPLFTFMGADTNQRIVKNPMNFALKAFAGGRYSINENTWFMFSVSWLDVKASAKNIRVSQDQVKYTDPVSGQIVTYIVYSSSEKLITRPVKSIMVSAGLSFRL